MGLVAIIDDRVKVRQRLLKRFNRYLGLVGVKWGVKDFDPLESKEDYPKWISENKVVILVVDEKLKEEKNGSGGFASYNGHELVEEVRKTNKQLPIYIVTSHAGDDELIRMEGEFEGIVQRDKFTDPESANQQFKKFVRATQTYLDNFHEEYRRLAELSEKIALSEITDEEEGELKALQMKIQMPLSDFVPKDRQEWLKDLRDKTDELNALCEEIENYLNK